MVENQLGASSPLKLRKCQPFWARLPSFGQLGLISDPQVNS